MIRLLEPALLLLLIPLLILGWRYRAWRLASLPRALSLTLLLLALAGLEWKRPGEALDLWVLVDRSASAEEALAPRLEEWESLLRRHQRGDDALHFLDFAVEAFPRGRGEGGQFAGATDETDLTAAVARALSERQPGRAQRLLLLSDGQSTQPMRELEMLLARTKVPLDYRVVTSPAAGRARISRWSGPTRVTTGEVFLLEAEVRQNLPDGNPAPDGTQIPFRLERGRELLGRGNITLTQGRGALRVTESVQAEGVIGYRLVLEDESVGPPSTRTWWVRSEGTQPVLLLTRYDDDPVAEVLNERGIPVITRGSAGANEAALLGSVRAVIINDLAATHLTGDFQQALAFHVREEGGGLLMAGGPASFGSGGYFGTPVEEVLPVSLESILDDRKLATAMALVLDRSGSMGATVSSPSGETLTKMDLAAAGAVQTMELLGPQDALAVFAVDTQAHEIVPLTRIADNRGRMLQRLAGIVSMGGGIYVYAGMQAGWEALAQTDLGQRHLVLFADAADAEEPGNYRALLETMREGSATVSVIALGSPQDADARLLEEIATEGGGRVFFVEDAATLPMIFAQETIAVSRSMFLEDFVLAQQRPGWRELTAAGYSLPGRFEAYNVTYLKETATVALATEPAEEEPPDPLISFWNLGTGRAAAVAFPVSGLYAVRLRSWEHYGDFLETLVRWLAGSGETDQYSVQTHLEGTRLGLTLHAAEEEALTLAARPPVALARVQGREEPVALSWQQESPGRYHAELNLQPGELAAGAIQAGDTVLRWGPVEVAGSVEWDFQPERVDALRRIAQASGGGYRANLAEAFERPEERAWRPLTFWLLLGALIVFLLDVLATRLGWDWSFAGKQPRAKDVDS